MYLETNVNPLGKRVEDCVIRAISLALDQSWDDTFLGLAAYAFDAKDMPNANTVWGKYLRDKGYTRHTLPDTCPDCYCVSDFTEEHPKGTFILAFDGHVACVKDGNLWDTWDSSGKLPLYYWQKDERSK